MTTSNKKQIKKNTVIRRLAEIVAVVGFFFISTASVNAQTLQAETEVQSDPVAEASALYKEMKQLQYGAGAEDELYEAVYKAYAAAFDALSDDNIDDAGADQCRGMLQDISSLLARGSVTYSMRGDQQNMARFAVAYAETLLMPQMLGAEVKKDPQLYPALIYSAAAAKYNEGQYNDAIKYFEEYFNTGETKQREQVSLFYGQAILKTLQQSRGIDTMVRASNEYPANTQILNIAMQLCIDAGQRDLLPPLLERALSFRPGDERLLLLQAQLFEENGEYRQALDAYNHLDELKPNNLGINEGIARCYYNLATMYYNESITAPDEKSSAKARRQSNAYFNNAAEKFEELSANDPNNTKYLKAVGTSYAIIGNKSKVDGINVRLQALGEKSLAMNTMPVVIGDSKAPSARKREIPSYQEYAQKYVTEGLTKWAARGEFEKLDDYNNRISAQGLSAEQARLSAITADKYLKEYASRLQLSEMNLQPYDVENETYAINSDFGPVYVNVPMKNHEAEIFKNSWEKVQIRNVKYFIQNDKIAISTITFQSPSGKDYTYNSAAAVNYKPVVVDVDANLIASYINQGSKKASESGGNGGPTVVKRTLESDVDKNIPLAKGVNTNTIALVIANENYKKVIPVASANHDGEVFAQYCRETLGIPANQVILIKDATYGNMLSAVNQLKNTVSAMGPQSDVIVYYAGHGVPDENTKDAYLLPVDADPQVMATAYSLKTFYDELGKMNANDVMVFIDACFSGANRGDGMLAEARGVVLKAKAQAPQGNMFVLSAASGSETALPYKEKNHGLFTYYLLKKLQDSKGAATLRELSDYVTNEVRKTASLQLNKPQTPTMTVSGSLAGQLDSKKLK